MTHDHPDYRRALDRSLPLAERRQSYRRWAESQSAHIHPGRGWHSHAGGVRTHTHHEEPKA